MIVTCPHRVFESKLSIVVGATVDPVQRGDVTSQL